MSWSVVIPGLVLPGKNDVTRWHWAKQRRETKRVRDAIMRTPCPKGKPLEHAAVKLTIYGPYRHDRHSIWIEDVLDGIVARPIKRWANERRWGLIVDDKPSVIGMPEVEVIKAPAYSVRIQVDERP